MSVRARSGHPSGVLVVRELVAGDREIHVVIDAQPGDAIIDPADPDGAPVGVLTSVAGGKGLGYVRRGSAVGDVPGGPNP